MDAFVIASTRHFKINNQNVSIDENKIFYNKSEASLDKFINDISFWGTTGKLFKQSLINKPFLYKHFSADNSELFLREAGNTQIEFQLILDFLWFVKDCSCHVHLVGGKLSNDDCILAGGGKIRYNALGERADVSFNGDDFDLVTKVMIAINSILKANYSGKVIENLVHNEGVVSFDRKLHYHDIEKANRVILFLKSARSTNVLPEKISNYVVVLEMLFANNTKDEIQHKVAERMAFYVADDYHHRLALFKFLKLCYRVRSNFVHGAKVDNKVNSNYDLKTLSVELDGLVRKILLRVYLDDADKFFDEKKLDDWFNEIIFNRVFSRKRPSNI